MTSESPLDRATRLRREFDDAFARAPAPLEHVVEDLLAIRVGGEPYALRLAEVASIHADLAIVAVPTPVATLRGITGLRSELLPVYDLGALLGVPVAGEPRWLVVARGPAPIAFAFDELEAHVRVATAELVGPVAGAMRPILPLASMVTTIERQVRQVGSPEGT